MLLSLSPAPHPGRRRERERERERKEREMMTEEFSYKQMILFEHAVNSHQEMQTVSIGQTFLTELSKILLAS